MKKFDNFVLKNGIKQQKKKHMEQHICLNFEVNDTFKKSFQAVKCKMSQISIIS